MSDPPHQERLKARAQKRDARDPVLDRLFLLLNTAPNAISAFSPNEITADGIVFEHVLLTSDLRAEQRLK